MKNKIAKLALQGLSILGMFLGLSFVSVSIMVAFSLPRDRLAAFLDLSAGLLILGLLLTYTSCLMFLGRSFGAIRCIAAGLAIVVLGSVVDPIYHFAVKWVNGIESRTFVGFVSFSVSLFLSVLVYLVCSRFLRRLVKVAYHTYRVSG